jgi:hypothetical protein
MERAVLIVGEYAIDATLSEAPGGVGGDKLVLSIQRLSDFHDEYMDPTGHTGRTLDIIIPPSLDADGVVTG